MIFCPCWVTSQTGPTFSVTSMRPSGRNAMRHGRLNVATWVIVNGRSGCGFNSPALIWARAADDTRMSNSAACPAEAAKRRRRAIRSISIQPDSIRDRSRRTHLTMAGRSVVWHDGDMRAGIVSGLLDSIRSTVARLLPTLVLEFVPFTDMLPTWTGCVALVVRARRRQGLVSDDAAPAIDVKAEKVE